MTFDEVLPALREGGRTRRGRWTGKWSGWLEMTQPGPAADGRAFDRAIFFWNDHDKIFRTWVASWDVVADDWEILPDEH